MAKPKNYDFFPNFRNMKIEPGFLTFRARLAFAKLVQTFVKALILYYFNLKYYIQIKTNASRYIIGKSLS